MTLAVLAQRTGIDQAALSRTVSTICRIAAALGKEVRFTFREPRKFLARA